MTELHAGMSTGATMLRGKVYEALENAKVNGEFEKDGNLYGKSPLVITYDLRKCCSEVEDEAPESIFPHVKEWMGSLTA